MPGGAEGTALAERLPHAVVARLRVRPPGQPSAEIEEGILFDPLGEPAFCEELLRAIRDDLARPRQRRRPGGLAARIVPQPVRPVRL